MSGEEVQFLKVLENTMGRWTLEYIRTGNSCTFHIKGTYHHMSGEEVQFLKVLENTTERWTLECIRTGNIYGAVLHSSHSGKGHTPEDWAAERLNIPLLFLIFAYLPFT